MKVLTAVRIHIAARSVDVDINKYVTTQLSRDRKIYCWIQATKVLIEETFSQRADEM